MPEQSQETEIQHPTHRGIQIPLREKPAKRLWEARPTIDGQRKSFYGNSYDSALEKAKAYIDARSGLADAAQLREQDESFASFLATQLGALYTCSPQNTRNQALWAIAILIDTYGQHKTRDLRLNLILNGWNRIKSKYPKPHSQQTIRKFLTRGLRLAVREGLIGWNYAEEVKYETPGKREYVPTVEDWRKLWTFHRDHPLWGPKFFLEGVLGFRDTEANEITADMIGETSIFCPGTKTENAERTIEVPPAIAAILKDYARDGRFLVRNINGDKVLNTQNRDLKKAYDQAGVRYAANHGLRHMFGQIESGLGCPRSIRKAILGQSTRSDVGDLYVHPTPENIRYWLQKWADHLGLEGDEFLPGSRGTSGVPALDADGVIRRN